MKKEYEKRRKWKREGKVEMKKSEIRVKKRGMES